MAKKEPKKFGKKAQPFYHQLGPKFEKPKTPVYTKKGVVKSTTKPMDFPFVYGKAYDLFMKYNDGGKVEGTYTKPSGKSLYPPIESPNASLFANHLFLKFGYGGAEKAKDLFEKANLKCSNPNGWFSIDNPAALLVGKDDFPKYGFPDGSVKISPMFLNLLCSSMKYDHNFETSFMIEDGTGYFSISLPIYDESQTCVGSNEALIASYYLTTEGAYYLSKHLPAEEKKSLIEFWKTEAKKYDLAVKGLDYFWAVKDYDKMSALPHVPLKNLLVMKETGALLNKALVITEDLTQEAYWASKESNTGKVLDPDKLGPGPVISVDSYITADKIVADSIKIDQIKTEESFKTEVSKTHEIFALQKAVASLKEELAKRNEEVSELESYVQDVEAENEQLKAYADDSSVDVEDEIKKAVKEQVTERIKNLAYYLVSSSNHKHLDMNMLLNESEVSPDLKEMIKALVKQNKITAKAQIDNDVKSMSYHVVWDFHVETKHVSYKVPLDQLFGKDDSDLQLDMNTDFKSASVEALYAIIEDILSNGKVSLSEPSPGDYAADPGGDSGGFYKILKM